jgi:hypothetical protein
MVDVVVEYEAADVGAVIDTDGTVVSGAGPATDHVNVCDAEVSTPSKTEAVTE